MASYTVTAVDPSLAILGVPTELRNVSGAAAALKAVQELADKGKKISKLFNMMAARYPSAICKV